MKLEIKKELRTNGKIWYCCYYNGEYRASDKSLEDAKETLCRIKEAEGIKPEIVYTEEYEPSEDNQNPA